LAAFRKRGGRVWRGDAEGTESSMSETGDTDVTETTKRAAGWLLWVLVLLVIVAGVIGLLLLGPFGIAVAIPLIILAFLIFGSSSSGPATGA
jgi:hypothetical protein